MSTPTNRLAVFRSYTYFHVLVACDSADTVSSLVTNGTFNDITALNSVTRENNQRAVQYVTGNQQGYIVMVDGARDADLQIEEIIWDSYLMNYGSDPSEALPFAFNGTLKIFEPRNVSFINTLIKTSQMLGTNDILSMPFIIKTYFVGVTDGLDNSGVPQQQVISDIDPLTVYVTNITAVIDQTGTTYEVTFFNMGDGLTGLTQYRELNAGNIGIAPSSGQMSTVMQKLESKLNEAALADYTNILAQARTDQSNTSPNAPLTPGQNLIKRQFKILLCPPYTDPKYVVDCIPAVTQTGGAGESPAISVAPASDIYKVFKDIFQYCPAIGTDDNYVNLPGAPGPGSLSRGTTSTQTGITIFPRVYAQVTRSVTGTQGTTKIYEELVTFIVAPYRLPYGQKAETISGDPSVPAINNQLIFDYYYSGNNVDIITFDMKFDNLNTMLVTATNVYSSGSIPPASNNQPNSPKQQSTGITSASKQGKIAQAMAFFQSRGWTVNQSAGIVANLLAEADSNFDSTSVNASSGAYGIGQWLGARKTLLFSKYADPSNFNNQLDYVDYELNNSESTAGNALRQASTPSAAADVMLFKYERPFNSAFPATGAGGLQRIAKTEAKAIQLAQNPPSLASNTNDVCTTSSSTQSGQIQALTPTISTNPDGTPSTSTAPSFALQSTVVSPRDYSAANAAASDTTPFAEKLKYLAAISSLFCKIQIHGNPDLLGNISNPFRMQPSDSDTVESFIKAVQNANTSACAQYWRTQPVFVKLNVFRPKDEATPGGAVSNFINDFWYQGWYQIYSVQHRFSGGQFLQEIDMYAKIDDLPNPFAGGVSSSQQSNQTQTRGAQQPPTNPGAGPLIPGVNAPLVGGNT